MAAWIATFGLALDIIGVILIWKFDLGKGLPIRDSDGKEHVLSLGADSDRKPFKRFLSRLGLPMVLAGFALQIVALWVP